MLGHLKTAGDKVVLRRARRRGEEEIVFSAIVCSWKLPSLIGCSRSTVVVVVTYLPCQANSKHYCGAKFVKSGSRLLVETTTSNLLHNLTRSLKSIKHGSLEMNLQ